MSVKIFTWSPDPTEQSSRVVRRCCQDSAYPASKITDGQLATFGHKVMSGAFREFECPSDEDMYFLKVCTIQHLIAHHKGEVCIRLSIPGEAGFPFDFFLLLFFEFNYSHSVRL